MENLCYHSNQSTNLTGKENTIYVEANVKHVFQVSASPPLWFLRGFFNIFFENLTLYVARQPIKIKPFGQKSYEMWRTT